MPAHLYSVPQTLSRVQLGSTTQYGLRSTKTYFFLKIFQARLASAQSPNTPEILFLLSITDTKQLFLYVQLASSGKQFGGRAQQAQNLCYLEKNEILFLRMVLATLYETKPFDFRVFLAQEKDK